MEWSRTKKAVLVVAALVTVGITGRAAAQESPPHHPPAARQPATAGHSAGTPSPSTSPSPAATTTHPVAPNSPAGTTPAKLPLGKTTGGPAGSHRFTGTAAVALTFDDGPDPAQTPQLLKLLAQQHVRATFCVVGTNVQRHPELIRQIVAGGHTLCDHSWNHSLTLGKQPAAAILADLRRTNAAIRAAAPGAKIEYFRAPGGNFTPRLVAAARELGMTSLYWKVDPRDWDHPKGESHAAHRAKVINAVEKHVSKGAIILSHDYAQPDTIAAYRVLIPWLRHRYQLIALPL